MEFCFCKIATPLRRGNSLSLQFRTSLPQPLMYCTFIHLSMDDTHLHMDDLTPTTSRLLPPEWNLNEDDMRLIVQGENAKCVRQLWISRTEAAYIPLCTPLWRHELDSSLYKYIILCDCIVQCIWLYENKMCAIYLNPNKRMLVLGGLTGNLCCPW